MATENKKVSLNTRVTGYATPNHPFVKDENQPMKEGDAFDCGVVLLPHLEKKGYATSTAPKAVKAEATAKA